MLPWSFIVYSMAAGAFASLSF